MTILALALQRGRDSVAVSELTAEIPRGIRNNNAGNLRYNPANQWKGQIGQDDAGFSVFMTPYDGIRAMARTLRNYMRVHNLRTITGIIHRYAPPSENTTAQYAAFVGGKMGKSAHEVITEHDIRGLVEAMIYMENGQQPYSGELLDNAVNDGVA